MSKSIKHLVVDTGAFIKAKSLQDIGENIYTVQEVIEEVTCREQRRHLVVLPYELRVKEVFTENIKFITDFAKKTGDYTSLSATDIKVLALTYQMEKEMVGTEHLKTEPTTQRIVKVTGVPNRGSNTNDNATTEETTDSGTTVNDETGESLEEKLAVVKDTSESKLNIETGEVENSGNGVVDDEEGILEQIKNIDLKDEQVDELMVKLSDEEEQESGEEDSDSDGGEWITPGNLATKKKELELGEFEEKSVEVACVTLDFAMQNVLKQIGLNVTAVDGRIIKQLRTFIFRCTTCFKTTSIMTKLFCPNCGHATLRKVGVSYDEEGNQHIHINGRKPLTARGKKFSLPTPKGGLHFQYPILTEDQHIHKRFATKAARSKTKALDPDYTAGFSPFATRDVNSRSAVLGVKANRQDVKCWMKSYSKGKK